MALGRTSNASVATQATVAGNKLSLGADLPRLSQSPGGAFGTGSGSDISSRRNLGEVWMAETDLNALATC
jgi:hypothetical protein